MKYCFNLHMCELVNSWSWFLCTIEPNDVILRCLEHEKQLAKRMNQFEALYQSYAILNFHAHLVIK
jgi:hypothetical protein